jgi:hypothetical protein
MLWIESLNMPEFAFETSTYVICALNLALVAIWGIYYIVKNWKN